MRASLARKTRTCLTSRSRVSLRPSSRFLPMRFNPPSSSSRGGSPTPHSWYSRPPVSLAMASSFSSISCGLEQPSEEGDSFFPYTPAFNRPSFTQVSRCTSAPFIEHASSRPSESLRGKHHSRPDSSAGVNSSGDIIIDHTSSSSHSHPSDKSSSNLIDHRRDGSVSSSSVPAPSRPQGTRRRSRSTIQDGKGVTVTVVDHLDGHGWTLERVQLW